MAAMNIRVKAGKPLSTSVSLHHHTIMADHEF